MSIMHLPFARCTPPRPSANSTRTTRGTTSAVAPREFMSRSVARYCCFFLLKILLKACLYSQKKTWKKLTTFHTHSSASEKENYTVLPVLTCSVVSTRALLLQQVTWKLGTYAPISRIIFQSMAKAIAGICIVSNVVSIWPAILSVYFPISFSFLLLLLLLG